MFGANAARLSRDPCIYQHDDQTEVVDSTACQSDM